MHTKTIWGKRPKTFKKHQDIIRQKPTQKQPALKCFIKIYGEIAKRWVK